MKKSWLRNKNLIQLKRTQKLTKIAVWKLQKLSVVFGLKKRWLTSTSKVKAHLVLMKHQQK
jgi:hypothetical protein